MGEKWERRREGARTWKIGVRVMTPYPVNGERWEKLGQRGGSVEVWWEEFFKTGTLGKTRVGTDLLRKESAKRQEGAHSAKGRGK